MSQNKRLAIGLIGYLQAVQSATKVKQKIRLRGAIILTSSLAIGVTLHNMATTNSNSSSAFVHLFSEYYGIPPYKQSSIELESPASFEYANNFLKWHSILPGIPIDLRRDSAAVILSSPYVYSGRAFMGNIAVASGLDIYGIYSKELANAGFSAIESGPLHISDLESLIENENSLLTKGARQVQDNILSQQTIQSKSFYSFSIYQPDYSKIKMAKIVSVIEWLLKSWEAITITVSPNSLDRLPILLNNLYENNIPLTKLGLKFPGNCSRKELHTIINLCKKYNLIHLIISSECSDEFCNRQETKNTDIAHLKTSNYVVDSDYITMLNFHESIFESFSMLRLDEKNTTTVIASGGVASVSDILKVIEFGAGFVHVREPLIRGLVNRPHIFSGQIGSTGGLAFARYVKSGLVNQLCSKYYQLSDAIGAHGNQSDISLVRKSAMPEFVLTV